MSLSGGIPGFAVTDKFHSSAAADFCSTEFDRDLSQGSRKSREKTTYDKVTGRAHRATLFPDDGGESDFDVASCARDALTFVYFARSELGHGRVPPQQQIYYGGPRSIRMELVGAQTIAVGGKPTAADHLLVHLKGPKLGPRFRHVLRARRGAHAALHQGSSEGRGVHHGIGSLMRVAFVSPLPPSRSGIADYSAALVEAMRSTAGGPGGPFHIETFSDAGQAFHPERFDIAVYQVGNNGHHGFVYQAALRHPGVVVMHESNLHHLIADLTIRRDDWDAYLAECEYDGGPAARAFAERVRRLEEGPDYEGVRMTRRLLGAAARRHRAQPVHGRRNARGRLRRADSGDSARRLDP